MFPLTSWCAEHNGGYVGSAHHQASVHHEGNFRGASIRAVQPCNIQPYNLERLVWMCSQESLVNMELLDNTFSSVTVMRIPNISESCLYLHYGNGKGKGCGGASG